jgi:hypothetical protein
MRGAFSLNRLMDKQDTDDNSIIQNLSPIRWPQAGGVASVLRFGSSFCCSGEGEACADSGLGEVQNLCCKRFAPAHKESL